jgi:phage FluMu gp28-like protein
MDGAYKGPGELRDFVVFERPTCVLDKKGIPEASTTDRITIDELLDDYRDMPLTGFLREYCLEWMDSIGEVFSQELINKMIRWEDMPKDTSDAKCVAGLDIGKKRNVSVLTIGELTGSGTKVIDIIEWPLETKYHEIAEDIMAMRTDFPNLQYLVIDETGVGKGVIEIFEKQIQEKWKNLELIGFDFSGPKKKIDLVEGAITELEQGRSDVIFNQKLVSEMLEFKREITPQGNTKYQKPVGGSDDFVDSLLLCLYAGRDYYGWTDTEEHVETSGHSILSRSASRIARIPI